MKTHGRFIVIEGLDGIGKSTTIGRLCERLNAQTASSPTPLMNTIRERFHDAEPICETSTMNSAMLSSPIPLNACSRMETLYATDLLPRQRV